MDWELRDDDYNGRYEKKILYGFAVRESAVDQKVPTHVPIEKNRKSEAESIQCGNDIVSICFGARMWANDHDNHMPSDFLSLSNELSATKLMICPSDHSHQPAPTWSALSTNNISYEIVTTNLLEGDTNGVFMRCKIHGHLGYATVFDGINRRTKIP